MTASPTHRVIKTRKPDAVSLRLSAETARESANANSPDRSITMRAQYAHYFRRLRPIWRDRNWACLMTSGRRLGLFSACCRACASASANTCCSISRREIIWAPAVTVPLFIWRPKPRLRKPRPAKGKFPKPGTPRLTEPTLLRLTPPNNMRPPSGTLTVVFTRKVLTVGNVKTTWPAAESVWIPLAAHANNKTQPQLANEKEAGFRMVVPFVVWGRDGCAVLMRKC